jgi:hypothetical protein
MIVFNDDDNNNTRGPGPDDRTRRGADMPQVENPPNGDDNKIEVTVLGDQTNLTKSVLDAVIREAVENFTQTVGRQVRTLEENE